MASADEHERAHLSPGEEHVALPRDELRRRASAGIFIVATRGLAILLLGFAGNVIVARLLSPRDFGIVAIGMTFVALTGLLSDGGLGAGLIRRAEPPKTEELEALTALQLTVTAVLALVIAVVATPFGEVGWVIALMMSAAPLVALQFPGRILLERSLRYRPLAVVEVSQVLTYNLWAIGFVVAGFGVLGLASATVARAVVGAVVMARVSPARLVRPRFSWRRIRPLVGFGLRFQAATAAWLVGDQALNASIAVIASISTLGFWSLARRLMEVPYLLFQSAWRVSFPAVSQLVSADAKENAAPLVERAAGMAAVGSGMLLAGLAGSAPGLVPGLFGDQWRATSGVIPWACLGLGIGGSVSVATQGYLYAVGDATAVLRAVILRTLTLLAVTVSLLPVLDLTAVGVGWLVSSVVEAVVLSRATRRWIPVRLLTGLVAPVLVGVVAGGVGWQISYLGGADLRSGLTGGVLSVVCYGAGLLLFRRALVYETFSFVLRSIRAAASQATPPTTT
jgi:O-antigen/teichoic acid export membrane protein